MAILRTITSLVGVRYGVNILEVEPVGQVEGVGTSIVAVIAETPWGPVSTPTAVSGASLFETFAPGEFQVTNDYDAMKAFLNKTFPSIVRVIRPAVTGAAAATVSLPDSVPNDVLDITAKYPGAVGNLISYELVANATVANNRDLTVRVRPTGLSGDPTYEVTYENVVVDDGASVTVNDPGDPFVTLALNAGAAGDAPDVVAETLLTGGADGTAVAGDYSTAIDLLADASTDWNVAFVAEPPSGLIADINTAIDTFVDTNDRGLFLYCTPAGVSASSVLTAAASLRTDRTAFPWPLVKTVNGFDPNRGEITVQGNSFAAVAFASAQPYESPGGALSADFLLGISGLEDGITASDAELEAAKDAGIMAFFNSRQLGVIIRGAVTTDVSSVDARRVYVRRFKDYVAQSIANFLVRYAERPLDIDLSNRRLGPITGPEIGAVRQFLQTELDQGRLVAYVLDEFGGNVQSNIDAGRWIIDLRAKFVSAQEEIVFRIQAGTTVVVDEEV